MRGCYGKEENNLSGNSLEIINKLSLLGITSKYGENPIRMIETFEATIEGALPKDYKEFLCKFGTLNFDNAEVVFCPENEDPLSVVNFYGLNGDNYDLQLIINRYADRIPNELIPIAECPGGDQLCIGINNKVFGEIYYWDHNREYIQVNTSEEWWRPLTLFFNTFFDLIISSQGLKEDKGCNDSTIENISVSENFLARFKK